MEAKAISSRCRKGCFCFAFGQDSIRVMQQGILEKRIYAEFQKTELRLPRAVGKIGDNASARKGMRQ